MNNLSIFNWNIRGICNFGARKNLSDFVNKYRPSIICIQETKCSNWSDSMKDMIWSPNDHGWLFSMAQGLSGGIMLSWDLSLISKMEDKVSRYWIHFRGSIIPDSVVINVVSVYYPQETTGKIQLWSELQALMLRFKGYHSAL